MLNISNEAQQCPREQGAGSKEQGAGSREQGAGSREQRARSREQGAGSREQVAIKPLHPGPVLPATNRFDFFYNIEQIRACISFRSIILSESLRNLPEIAGNGRETAQKIVSYIMKLRNTHVMSIKTSLISIEF